MYRKSIKPVIAALAVIIALLFSQAAFAVDLKPEWKKNPQTLWNALHKNWNEKVNTYTSDIFAWGYKTQYYIDNIDDKPAPGKGPKKVDYNYRVYQTRFRKPAWILFSYSFSAHEHTDEGSLIDRAVAYVLLYTGGTTFNYGYKGTDVAYIKFPYISNSEFKKYPIPLSFKAAMKLLMIASRGEVYRRPLKELRDMRGNSIDSLIIGKTMNRFDKFFALYAKKDPNVKISVEPSPRLTKEDYTLDEKTGWLTLKPASAKKAPTLIKIVLSDKNEKRTKGVNMFEAFVDPATMMFVGLHEYEHGKLVGVTQFVNLKLNEDLPANLWEDYFKGRKIADR